MVQAGVFNIETGYQKKRNERCNDDFSWVEIKRSEMLDGTDLLWTSNIRVEVSLKCSMLKGTMLEERKSGIACSLNFAKLIRP